MATRPRLNRAHAIRESCKECMNFQVHMVNECTDRACPLWEWRRGDGGPEWTAAPLRRQTQHTSPAKRPRRVLALKTGDGPAVLGN